MTFDNTFEASCDFQDRFVGITGQPPTEQTLDLFLEGRPIKIVDEIIGFRVTAMKDKYGR